MLDPNKEYALRAKIGEQWKTMVSAKLNDKGNASIGISPELIGLLQSGKWANLSLSVYDKKESGTQKASTTQDSWELSDEVPF